MSALRRLAAAALLICLAALTPVGAQRRVTPVKSTGGTRITGTNENSASTDSIVRSRLVERVNDDGRKVLVDSVTGVEVNDSIPEGAPLGRVPKMLNPLLFSASVGVDIWDPLMRIFGQKYGLIGFSASMNLHNRYIPVFEAGLGMANDTPANQNYTYHGYPAPYFRLGMDYNFLYNSNPDYKFVAGLRLGWTNFKYQLRDVELDDPYWGTSQTINFPDHTSSALFLNVLIGLKVKVAGPISMGWNIRVRTILNETKQPEGKPWYIPGYGARNGILTGTFSVYYTFNFDRKKEVLLPDADLDNP